jgi:hypothetical protein
MERILQEIAAAWNARLFYVAIAQTLTLPDICAALESADGRSSGSKFKDWYSANAASAFPLLTGEDVWCLRCGVLHQGRFGHPAMQFGRVVFTLPNPQNIDLHMNVRHDALNLDGLVFCSVMARRVRLWMEANKENATVQANMQSLVQFRPNGLENFIVGVPIIA